MKVPKKLAELVNRPQVGTVEVIAEITPTSIELRGRSHSKIEFRPGKYTYVDLADTVLTDAVGNNVSSFRSTMIRCQFTSCQFTGLQLPEGNFKHVIFENCRLNLTNFRSSVFENCIFRSCDLSEADFAMSKLTNVLFEDCQLIKTEFSNCFNKRIEFENSGLGSLKGVSGIKGATISSQNLIEIAPLLATELGMRVRD